MEDLPQFGIQIISLLNIELAALIQQSEIWQTVDNDSLPTDKSVPPRE
jgi:hypothetical protein